MRGCALMLSRMLGVFALQKRWFRATRGDTFQKLVRQESSESQGGKEY
jgi:hypothetical protein